MTNSEKLAAILAAVQTDPGNRGLARDPDDNLFTATAGDFERACRSIAEHPEPILEMETGFYISNGTPPAFETDGPLGVVFLLRSLGSILRQVGVSTPRSCGAAIAAGARTAKLDLDKFLTDPGAGWQEIHLQTLPAYCDDATHAIALEQVGRAGDYRYYSMRGRDITEYANCVDGWYLLPIEQRSAITIGIGDGGNEIGMGRIPHETIVKNISNGDLIHCRVPTDHLIVAGVSNWGAYALAAGIFVLRGVKPPADLFDPDRELVILEAMVREGPLVDGVTGLQTATVDGLTWDEYSRPLIAIQRILDS